MARPRLGHWASLLPVLLCAAWPLLSLPDMLAWERWVRTAALAAFVSGAFLGVRQAKLGWALAAASAIPAFALLVVVRDTNRDPTSHNLWPFELAFDAGFSVVATALGLAGGRGLARVLRA